VPYEVSNRLPNHTEPAAMVDLPIITEPDARVGLPTDSVGGCGV
jgi:hypothetical protein